MPVSYTAGSITGAPSTCTDLGPPLKMTPGRLPGRDLLGRDRVRHDLAVDVRLAYSTGDQLCVLRAEVDDEDGVELVLGQ